MGDPVSDFLLVSAATTADAGAVAATGAGAAAAVGAGAGVASVLSPFASSLLLSGGIAAGGMALQGKPKTDPNLTAEQNAALQDSIDSLKVQTEGDTASLLARYGQRVAMANATGTAPTIATSR